MSAAIIGRIKYYGGANGTVTLAKDEKLIAIWAVGGSGGYLTINGGDQIPIPASTVFSDWASSRTEEWVGAVLVFHATTSYYVKTKTKSGPT